MLKNASEALYITLITSVFAALAVVLKNSPTWVGVLLFIATAASVYFIVWKGTRRIKDAVASPESHPVFYTIDNGIKIAFDYLPIKHPKKKKLVVLYIKTKYNLVREALTATIADDKITELPLRIVTAVADTKDKLRGMAPSAFLDKMSEWDNKYNAWTMDTLRSIVDSNFYANKSVKYCACFDCVQVMVRSTLVAAENTINELNGELEKHLDGEENG